MKYSLPVNCREIGICHKSSMEKIPGNRYDRPRISSRYVLTFHVPDWLGWYHHCWRSVPPRRSISPALRPSRPSSSCSSSSYLRALRGHAVRPFVVPRRRSGCDVKKKKGEEREKNEGGKKRTGWLAGWLKTRKIVIATAWPSHGHDDWVNVVVLSRGCATPSFCAEILAPSHESEESRDSSAAIRSGERSWRKSPRRRVTSRSLSSSIDRADSQRE